jgi:putative Holliday junction resolvase
MKHLGIDFGTKRIGIALSDEQGTIAFPKEILQNSKNLIHDILTIITQENIGKIVVGKSIDQQGNRNSVMDQIDLFIQELQKNTDIPVFLQDEQFTSHFSKSFDFTKSIEKPISRSRTKKVKNTSHDAQAAAMILQRFLENPKA